MKKILSTIPAIVLAALMIVLMLGTGVYADEALPFELKTPESISLYQVGDSHECNISVGLDTQMQKFFQTAYEAEDRAEFFAKYGYEDLYVTMQMDWALDDVNDAVSGWHYNKYWDWNDEYSEFGRDNEGRYHHSDWDIIDEHVSMNDANHDLWVFRGMNNDWYWYGDPDSGWVGVKEQMRPDQYTAIADGDYLTINIDFTQHTFYVRVRFILVGCKTGADKWSVVQYTDWSKTAAYGKDGKKYEPLTPEDLPKPVISNLYMTNLDFNGNPVAAYTIEVPDELVEKITDVTAKGGSVRLSTYMRIKGEKEWTDMQNADFEVKSGEIQVPLLHLVNEDHPNIPKDTPLEVRVHFWCYQPGYDDFCSEWSDILVLNTAEIDTHNDPTPIDYPPDTTPDPIGDPIPEAEKDCWLCHKCSQPLGLCIWIWILIIIIVIIIVVVIIIVAGKKKKKKDEDK